MGENGFNPGWPFWVSFCGLGQFNTALKRQRSSTCFSAGLNFYRSAIRRRRISNMPVQQQGLLPILPRGIIKMPTHAIF